MIIVRSFKQYRTRDGGQGTQITYESEGRHMSARFPFPLNEVVAVKQIEILRQQTPKRRETGDAQ